MDFRAIERIMIRSPNWVGDAVLSTPAVRAVRENFPAAQITLVAKPWVVPVFFHNPSVDNIYLYESEGRHGGWLGKVRLVKALRREGFDLAVLFQNAFEAALLVFLAGVRLRLGYATDCRRIFLTQAVDVHQRYRGGHQIGYYLGILEGASLESKGEQLTITISDRERVRAEQTLSSCNVRPESPLVGINPGGVYGSSKRWPLERYAALCEKIRRLLGAEIIIFGGPGEKAVGQKISSLMKGPCTDLCGRTNLREAIALIEKCRLFITNDSGLMHVAAALDIPLVAIFGSTDPQVTGPVNPRGRVVQSPVSCAPCFKRKCPEDHRCMKQISVDQVYDVVGTLL